MLGLLAGCTTKTVQTAPMFAARVVVAKAVQENCSDRSDGHRLGRSVHDRFDQGAGERGPREVHIKEGQFVKKGDLLFTLDARPFEAALAQAQAMLARDKAQAELNDSRRSATKRFTRRAWRRRNNSTRCRRTPTRSKPRCARTRLRCSPRSFRWTTARFTRPPTGAPGAIQVYPGNIVKQNDVPMLIVINQISPIFVDFAVPEQYFAPSKNSWAKGTLRVEATPYGDTKAETGALTFVDNTVDNTTGTIKLKGTFRKRRSPAVARAVFHSAAAAGAGRRRNRGSFAGRADRDTAAISFTW